MVGCDVGLRVFGGIEKLVGMRKGYCWVMLSVRYNVRLVGLCLAGGIERLPGMRKGGCDTVLVGLHEGL